MATTRSPNPDRRTATESPARARRRSAEVLDAAARVFYERGYAASTVQDVADELGILKGSLYHYIDTKEDLLARLLDEVFADVERTLEDVRALEGLDPIERLREYVRRQVLYNLTNLQRVAIYYHDAEQLGPERLKPILARRRAIDQFVLDLVVEAQKTGAIPPERDPRILTSCVFGTIVWTYRWYQPKRGSDREAVAAECAQYAIVGVVGPPAAATA